MLLLWEELPDASGINCGFVMCFYFLESASCQQEGSVGLHMVSQSPAG